MNVTHKRVLTRLYSAVQAKLFSQPSAHHAGVASQVFQLEKKKYLACLRKYACLISLLKLMQAYKKYSCLRGFLITSPEDLALTTPLVSAEVLWDQGTSFLNFVL